ncbi:MAG: hypothetical protein MRY63_13300 [Neomegalonema sp.]|nr:hypothetical protein [Neomegalonema sp.]
MPPLAPSEADAFLLDALGAAPMAVLAVDRDLAILAESGGSYYGLTLDKALDDAIPALADYRSELPLICDGEAPPLLLEDLNLQGPGGQAQCLTLQISRDAARGLLRVFVLDVTDQAERQQKAIQLQSEAQLALEQAEAATTRTQSFARVLADLFRSPLSIIAGNLDLLDQGKLSAAGRADLLRQTRVLEGRVSDFLSLAQADEEPTALNCDWHEDEALITALQSALDAADAHWANETAPAASTRSRLDIDLSALVPPLTRLALSMAEWSSDDACLALSPQLDREEWALAITSEPPLHCETAHLSLSLDNAKRAFAAHGGRCELIHDEQGRVRSALCRLPASRVRTNAEQTV